MYPKYIDADIAVTNVPGWRSANGRWLIPDWSAVAVDWDGVHISFGAYLSAAYRSSDLDNATTMLTGWNPDETAWLNPVFESARMVGEYALT
jgi:hypothetical protein